MSKDYPLWLEKMIFLGLIVLAVSGAYQLQEYLSGPLFWLATICGLPLMVLVTTEFLGRIIQSIHTR